MTLDKQRLNDCLKIIFKTMGNEPNAPFDIDRLNSELKDFSENEIQYCYNYITLPSGNDVQPYAVDRSGIGIHGNKSGFQLTMKGRRAANKLTNEGGGKMSEFTKIRGHHSYWLKVGGVSVAHFEVCHESFADEIVGMADTIAKQAKELEAANKRIEELESALGDFVSDHCDRAGYEDCPLPADEQDCPIIACGMRLLSK